MSIFEKSISNANQLIENKIKIVENGIDTKDVNVNKFFAFGKDRSPIRMIIGNKEFTEFNSLRISYSIDSACSAFSFDTIFYPSKGMSNTIKPFGLETVKIEYNDTEIFNGYIEKITTGYSNNGSNLNVQGRSKGGLLVDVDAKKAYYNSNSIVGIAQLNNILFVREPTGENFIAINIDEGENLFGILSKFASQKGMYAIPEFDGGLLFKKIKKLTKTSISIEDGNQNVLRISANFDITKRYYQYIGIKKGVSSKSAFDESINSIRGIKYFRGDDNSGDVSSIASKAKSRMIAESFTLAVSLSTWTLNNNLLQPGIIVKILSPMNMVYTPSDFVIKQIDYTYDINNGYIAEIQFTLPEAYTGENINTNFFGTYQEKDTNLFTKFTKIPDSKDVWDKASKIGQAIDSL
jgi:prophage tail gpP-like protein